jgi:MFS family permease
VGVRSKVTVLGAATAVNFAQFGTRVVASPFVIAIAATFGVTKGDIGGAFTDRHGGRRVTIASIGLSALGSVFVTLAPSFLVFVLAAVALGGGAGLYFAVGASLLAKRFQRQGQALRFHSAGAPLAGPASRPAEPSPSVHWCWSSSPSTRRRRQTPVWTSASASTRGRRSRSSSGRASRI